jgi:hypothetical protein
MTARPLLLVALTLGACGTNKPELPSGLSEPEACVVAGYPAGPYGTEPGAVAENACFEGWLRPDRVAHEQATLEPVRLSDFYDPTGARGVRLLLVNTSALWCSACRIEHETLGERAREFADRGLVVLSALFQGNDRKPATLRDLTLWVETYETDFPMVLDPDYSFGLYASAETAPLNLVIDPRSMRILQKFIGDQPAVMWPYIAAALECPAE